MGTSLYGFSDYDRQKVKAQNYAHGYTQIRSSMAFDKKYGNTHTLRSYVTDIITVDLNDCIIYVYDAFDCSRTTIRHVSTWLRATMYSDYHTIKEFALKYRRGISDEFFDENTGYIIQFMDQCLYHSPIKRKLQRRSQSLDCGYGFVTTI